MKCKFYSNIKPVYSINQATYIIYNKVCQTDPLSVFAVHGCLNSSDLDRCPFRQFHATNFVARKYISVICFLKFKLYSCAIV